MIASGGVATLDDLCALAVLEPAGLEGAIVGKALYAGRFTVTDAMAALAEAAGPAPGEGPGPGAGPVPGAPGPVGGGAA